MRHSHQPRSVLPLHVAIALFAKTPLTAAQNDAKHPLIESLFAHNLGLFTFIRKGNYQWSLTSRCQSDGLNPGFSQSFIFFYNFHAKTVQFQVLSLG